MDQIFLKFQMKITKVFIGDIITESKEMIEGIIIDVDYGFGMKYKDTKNLYLKLEVQQYNGWTSTQLFKGDKIPKLLLQFKNDYRTESGVKSLKHQTIYSLASESTNGIPDAIAAYPPSQYPQYEWIYNDNWS